MLYIIEHCKNLFFGEVNTSEKQQQCNLHEKVSSGKNLKNEVKVEIKV